MHMAILINWESYEVFMMPKFYEVYGANIYDTTPTSLLQRKRALCPFTNNTCDGGGNRHQTKIRLSDPELRNFFDDSLSTVIPGVCSIEHGNDVWIVCPRRLLGFQNNANERTITNNSLMAHERAALIAAGLPQDIELGVWSEVYLQYGDDTSSINYHFDFVITPIIRNCNISKILEPFGDISTNDVVDVRISARKGKYISGRDSIETEVPILPDIRHPFIIEVMTASTSGSDTEAGTDIASSFKNAILGQDHNCPGINKRQVWGRMATQLFSKSALAHAWNGKTIWLVQNQLLTNIELTTKLNLRTASSVEKNTVNFLSMKYITGDRGASSLILDQYVEIGAGLDFSGNGECTDILLPKIYPHKIELLKAMLRRELSAIIKL